MQQIFDANKARSGRKTEDSNRNRSAIASQ